MNIIATEISPNQCLGLQPLGIGQQTPKDSISLSNGNQSVRHDVNGTTSPFSTTLPDNLTVQQAKTLQEEFRSISVNGAPIDFEHLQLGKLLREIFTGQRAEVLHNLHINDESREILQQRYVNGAWWRDINEELGKAPVAYDGRQNVQGRARYALAKIANWLEPLGATPDTIKKVLDGLSDVKVEARKSLLKANNYATKWLESFHKWVNGTIKELRPIEFNLCNKDIAPAFKELIEKLEIKLPRLLQEGKLRPSKDKLGFVLETQDKKNNILQRNLMVYNLGVPLAPPREDSEFSFLRDRTAGNKYALYNLVFGFGPVDLIQALDTVSITVQNARHINKIVDLRVRKDKHGKDLDYGFQIPIPSIYKGDLLKPQILMEDLKSGNKRITFCNPQSKLPVIEVIFTEKGYETDYLGKYANPNYWRGATKKLSYETKKYLQGKRVTEPLLHKLKVYEHEGYSSLRFMGISVDLGKDFSAKEVSPAFLTTTDGSKALGIYVNESDSEPYLIYKMDGEEVKVESKKL